ncbi:penicillin-binding protein [Paenibacillus ferrarius]|uniref:Penicillin-binding protein n=1 Tax=Paenibacillus ferrarius TaxID=1469647 RepID=A0A1V4HFA9_9BACL|nr:serine hydrolase [Paenibacillus ferrarius]OPH53508.1 penicillin-binding protein [Paenibacillus ferrarius]
MKKWIRKKRAVLLLTVLVLTSTIINACTGSGSAPDTPQAPTSVASKEASLEGPRDAKELEAFADGIFADAMKKYTTVGSNFAVVSNGKVLLSKGYGYADRENKIPVDSSTVFQIGSVTKQFTALAAMQLVDKGKIDLHHDIQEYLGGMKVPNTTGKKLTMYDLLTYTSGFDKPDILSGSTPEYVNQFFPMKESLEANMPTVVRPPGEAYTYDNFGFTLAGYAVGEVTGMSFAQYMEENIFKPLGMNSTNVRFKPELLKRMAAHYGPKGELIPLEGFKPTDRPSGGMVSTADDMVKYLMMHLNKGTYGGKEILSPKSIEQMHTYQVFPDKEFPVTTIGFEGYFKEKMNGQHVVLKGGNVTGHSSLIVLLPEKNTAFYMSYNNDSMMSLDVYEAFMNHYYPKKDEAPQPSYSPISEQQAKDYTGLYQNTRLGSMRTRVSYSDGKLVMETGDLGKSTLKMIHPLLFEDESGNKVAFQKNGAGQITYFYYMTLPHYVGYAQKVNVDAPFTDVPADSKYTSYIHNLHALKIMDGKSATLFDPEGTLTQGEFSELLLHAHGWESMPYTIEPNKKQMLSGLPNYQPDSPVTRQMAAVMIQNLRQAQPGAKVTLRGETDAWAVEAITTLVSQGIMDPDTKINSDGSIDFRSKQLLKRQEASALLDLAFDYYTLPIRK